MSRRGITWVSSAGAPVSEVAVAVGSDTAAATVSSAPSAEPAMGPAPVPSSSMISVAASDSGAGPSAMSALDAGTALPVGATSAAGPSSAIRR